MFLGHATKNHLLVEATHRAMTEKGIDCYVAEYRKEPGRLTIHKIEDAIRSADAVVVLLTEEAGTSAFVNQEVGFARGELGGKKLVIPFVKTGVKLEGWLYGIEPIEFTEDTFEDELKVLVAYVEQLRADKERQEEFHPEETKPRVREKTIEYEAEPSFVLLELSDTSHALAKRYAANILLQGSYDREDARQVVQRAMDYVKNQNYHRNTLVERRWGGNKAHVVWLFVYRSPEDVDLANWICRAQWIAPGLDPAARPMAIEHDEELDGIMLDWNDSYEDFRQFYHDLVADKGDYLHRLDRIIGEATPALERAADLLKAYETTDSTDEEVIREMQDLGEKFRPLYLAAGEFLAPYECRELDKAFQRLMGHGDNIFLYFSAEGMEKWDKKARGYMARNSLSRAFDELKHLRVLRDRIT